MVVKDLPKKLKAGSFFSGTPHGGKAFKGGKFGSLPFSPESFDDFREEGEGGEPGIVSRIIYFVLLESGERVKEVGMSEWDSCFFYEPLMRVRGEMDWEEGREGEDFFSKALEFSYSIVSKEKCEEWERSRELFLHLLGNGNIVVFEPLVDVASLTESFVINVPQQRAPCGTSLTVVGNAVVDHLLTVPCAKEYLVSVLDRYKKAWESCGENSSRIPESEMNASVEAIEKRLEERSFAGGGNLVGLPASFKSFVIECVSSDMNSTAVVGGSSLNTARATSRLIGAYNSSQVPVPVSFIGAVGDDVSGELVTRVCENDHLSPWLFVDKETKTGQCGVLVNASNRDRTICCSRGASGSLSLTSLEGVVPKGVDFSNSVFFATSFMLTTIPRFEVVNSFAIRHRGFALSLSSSELMRGKSEVQQRAQLLLGSRSSYHDSLCIVFGTLEEAQAYTDCQEIEKCVDLLAADCVRPNVIIVVTDGPKDVTIGLKENEESTKVFKFPIPPLNKSEIVNTNGAGDAFAGGFLARWLTLPQQFDYSAMELSVGAGAASARQCLTSP